MSRDQAVAPVSDKVSRRRLEQCLPHHEVVLRLEELHQRPLHLPVPQDSSEVNLFISEWIEIGVIHSRGDVMGRLRKDRYTRRSRRVKDVQPQIGSKTPRGNGLAIAVEVAIIAAHDRINNLIDHVGRIGKYRRSPFVIGAGWELGSSHSRCPDRSGQPQRFRPLLYTSLEESCRIVGGRRAVVICCKTMARVG